MKVNLISATSLLCFFLLAWVPMGQQEFLIDHWMKLGAFIALIILFFAFKRRDPLSTKWSTDVFLMACLLTASYLAHQVEEHWVDLLGREYPLYDFLNSLIASIFGEEKYGILTRSGIFYVNAGMVWTAGFLAILTSPSRLFPSLAMAGIMLVNAIAHVVNALATLSYNSGTFTAIVLFFPFSIAFFVSMYRANEASLSLILWAVAWGFLGHVLLFGGLFAANVLGLVPIWAYYLALILWGVLPTLLASRLRPAR
ncbi:MAG: HXXEE domain-containing protein [Pseudomonadota bacterium]